jgi:hypothetical protein
VVPDDGDEEVDGARRGFDAALVAVALGGDGLDLPERCQLLAPTRAARLVDERGDAAGVDRGARGGEALDLVQGAPGLDEAADRVWLGVVSRSSGASLRCVTGQVAWWAASKSQRSMLVRS